MDRDEPTPGAARVAPQEESVFPQILRTPEPNRANDVGFSR